LLLLNKIRQKNKKGILIVTARQINEAFELYKAGADYVILPHFLGGEYTAKVIEEAKTDKRIYAKIRINHIKNLKERLKEGQEHPRVEKK
jgi:voltage-gated potassium channel Kch